MQPDSKRKRFPRLIRGNVAKVLKTILWNEPKLSVAITKKRNAMVFKFRVPVRQIFCDKYPELFEPFIGAGGVVWQKAISDAYSRARWGRKKVSHLVSTMLHLVYREAIDIWYADTLALLEDPKSKQTNLNESAPGAPLKRMQPDPSLASWVIARRDTLIPGIRALRIAVREKHNLSRENLVEEMRARIPSTIAPEEALSRLYGEEIGRNVNMSVFPVDQIAEAYIRCEMQKSFPKSGVHNLNSYIRVGKKNRKTLSDLTIIGKESEDS